MPTEDRCNGALEPLCKALDDVKLGCPLVLRDFEQDYADNELKNPMSHLK